MSHTDDLIPVLQEIMARWDVPGLAVGIVQGNEIAFASGFGVQSLETQAPVTPDSIFCVQSVSKCVVATAIMQEAEGGKLDLDAPLIRYLPYFRMDDHRYPQITTRQVLSHTSGMPDMDESEYIGWMAHPEYDDGAAERFVRSLSGRKLIADPGERFGYSNLAYNVLGDLLAKVSARTFESAMREQVLVPSGMPNSTFLPADVPVDRLAWPHLRSPEMTPVPTYPYQRADAPASFLHTTAMDLCHWCITCLHQGNYLGRSILSPASYDLMWKPVAKRGDPPSLFEEMGLGWSLGHYKGVKTICHGGAGFGSTAFLLILPESDCAAVVLCNEESSAHLRAIYAVADTLVGQKPQVNTVSWMVPVSRALAEGGIDAARARCFELKEGGTQEDYVNEYDLDSLALQLVMARKPDLAIEVLGLNIHVFPQHIDSYLGQAQLYLQVGQVLAAREILLRAVSLEPTNATAAGLLQRVQQALPNSGLQAAY